ncbi:AAA family ATPase [Photobacterium alginatilyticum]|uniref:MoxR family ATPase n=1 Tax=Photobacterium alginatilyticum TaxID=1775171 RepID=A0ABW9YLE8_9GAMM|nr:MoxR family ATPase [Photobacterium alginatilyticum]NBI54624.1 MoxR family ATPase [Photobacterium alginatilyticum]
MNQLQQQVSLLIEQVNQSVIGQQHVTRALVIGLLTNGHVLLEGLPGTAKTRSVKALAATLNASFGRVQFTPDLLPSDVTGAEMYQETANGHELRFQHGPIFNSILLADEVNRAPAKVQAALLEAMAESTVTVGEQSHALPELFMVLATQNPVEQEGTYPLPEAQMDRFIMKVNVDYPDDEAELGIIRLLRQEEAEANRDHSDDNQVSSTITLDPELILAARRELAQLEVSDMVERYIVALVMATRRPERYPASGLARWIAVGASPRASIALDKCARAYAWLQGREHVLPDDVRAMAPAVLGHRITLSYDALAEGVAHPQVVMELLDHVAIG